MPWCTLSIPKSLSAPMIAHAQWDHEKEQCTLWLFTDKKEAEKHLKTLSKDEETESFRDMLKDLEDASGETPTLVFKGVMAFMLTGFLIQFHDALDQISHTQQSCIFGFWGPSQKEGYTEGLLTWYETDTDHHAVIVHSKDQAERILNDLFWLNPGELKGWSGIVHRWDMRQYSSQKLMHVRGVFAELICKLFLLMERIPLTPPDQTS